MPDNDFKALAALSRNFFRADFSNRWSAGRLGRARRSPTLENSKRNFRRAKRRFRAPTGNPMQSLGRKATNFAWQNDSFGIAGRKPLKYLPARSCHFAGLFVFKALTAIWFRLFHTSRFPGLKAHVQRMAEGPFGTTALRPFRGNGDLGRQTPTIPTS
jgi:hypothetical protein